MFVGELKEEELLLRCFHDQDCIIGILDYWVILCVGEVKRKQKEAQSASLVNDVL
jgi:hypothetical protein